jgi:apolipoprotein D and lipocalin family protein
MGKDKSIVGRSAASIVLSVVFLLTALAGLEGSDKLLLVPVGNFDLQKYLGTWYEVARMPASFENGLVKVTATYSVRNDGKVKVLNRGYRDSFQGRVSTAVGKAKFAGDRSLGHLKVSFFGPFYADYVIVELDQGYNYALVISSRDYAWILSRTPVLDPAIMKSLIEKARGLGVDVSRLYMTPQQ